MMSFSELEQNNLRAMKRRFLETVSSSLGFNKSFLTLGFNESSTVAGHWLESSILDFASNNVGSDAPKTFLFD